MIFEINNEKVGFLSFTTSEINVKSEIATHKTPGCCEITSETYSSISKIKSGLDYLILNIHWGHEFFLYPSPNQRKIARKLANSGVDVIIGHHPHCVQAMEQIDKCTVFYSLGNAFFQTLKNSIK